MSTSTDQTTTEQPEILARGPWELEQIKAHWRDEAFEPSPQNAEAADAARNRRRLRTGMVNRLLTHQPGRLQTEHPHHAPTVAGSQFAALRRLRPGAHHEPNRNDCCDNLYQS